MRCLVTRRLTGDWEPPLHQWFRAVEVGPADRSLTPEELQEKIKDADVLICTVFDRVDEAVLAHAQRLKCVATYSVGYDHVDRAALARRGIAFCHTPGVLTDATADLTWALILGCARRVKAAMRWLEAGDFTSFDLGSFLGLELRGAVLGIVGLGKIGEAVARRAGGFGMRVIHSGRRPIETPYETVSLDELWQRSDVISLHCPLTPETRRLVGPRELGLMKANGILVNTSRGAVVDETALTEHLEKFPDFHAGLDVFEREPRVSARLLALPNALCLPHIGSAADATRRRMAEICVAEVIRFAKGEPLRYPVQ